MTLRKSLEFPKAIRQLSGHALWALCQALKQHLTKTHADTRALAAVELTLALHRVFRHPYDAVLFEDTTRALAHRMLTGHHPGFLSPSQAKGLPHPLDMFDVCHGPKVLAEATEVLKSRRLLNHSGKAIVVLEEKRPLHKESFEALSQQQATKLPWLLLLVRPSKREGEEGEAEAEEGFLCKKEVAAFFGSLGFPLWPLLEGFPLGETNLEAALAVLRQAKSAHKAMVVHVQLPG